MSAIPLQSVAIHKRRFTVQQEPLVLRGVRVPVAIEREQVDQLQQHHINLLLVPISGLGESFPGLADSMGIHVLYDVNPEDDPSLWYAEEVLSQHVSTLGYVLPQSAMAHPQLWHNAMLHLHRQRRDIFIGITIDTVPLTMVQGHVEFLVTPTAYLDDLAAVKMPLLETVRRFDLLQEEFPTGLAGRISRVMPDLQ